MNLKKRIKTLGIIMLIMASSIIVHEGVHVYQAYSDPNLTFAGFGIDGSKVYTYMEKSGEPILSPLEKEVYAYNVQLFYISLCLSIYIIKKEDDYDN